MTKYFRSQIVLVNLGSVPNQVVGHEQANMRPCLIVQTLDFVQLAVVIPFTSKTPPSNIYSIVAFQKGKGGLLSDSFALCHQIRTISYQRIIKSYGVLKEREFNKVLTVLSDFLEL